MKIYPRLFAFIALGFVLATIVGTVSHEYGHIAVAKFFGYETKLYYDSMNYNVEEKLDAIYAYYDKHMHSILLPSSPEKKYFEEHHTQILKEINYVRWGGPAQTMITGTIGVLMLWLRRKKIAEYGMKLTDWIFVLLAFFWSREITNFLIVSIDSLILSKPHTGGDEAHISRYYQIPWITINAITGCIAALVLLWVVFIVIPRRQRLTFITAGLAGSALGWMIWMEWVGPRILS